MTPESTKEGENNVSPGVSFELAARDLAARLGLALSDQEAKDIGSLFHYGLGLAAGEIYVLLRRGTSLRPMQASIVTGMTLFLGIDELLTPVMGWGAHPTAYPPATHIRGFLGHLTLGAVVAVVAEILWKLGSVKRF
jgi:uncharacterized membrane protein YagU involved in acid resistance